MAQSTYYKHTKDDIKRIKDSFKTQNRWSVAFDIALMRKNMGRGEARARGEDCTKFTLYELNRMLMEFYEFEAKAYPKFDCTTDWKTLKCGPVCNIQNGTAIFVSTK